MVRMLEGSGFGLSDESITPVPSYDRYGFAFSPTRYWRGPVWVNVNWLLAQGLDRYGFEDHARRLRKTIVSLCRNEGYYEYFDPLTGVGHGSDLFSWTAALLLDVMRDDLRSAAQADSEPLGLPEDQIFSTVISAPVAEKDLRWRDA